MRAALRGHAALRGRFGYRRPHTLFGRAGWRAIKRAFGDTL